MERKNVLKCEYCGEKIGLLEIKFIWLDKENNRAMHDKCYEEYKKSTDKKKEIDDEKGMDIIINEIKSKGAWDVVTKFSEKCAENSIVDYYWVVGLKENDKDIVGYSDVIQEIILDILSDVMDKDILPVAEKTASFSDIENLKQLLSVKYNIKITNDALNEVIRYMRGEIKRKEMIQELQNFKEFFPESLNTKEQYIDFFLKQYDEEYKGKLNLLYEFLQQKGFNFDSLDSLTCYVNDRKKLLELENFEKSLFCEKSEKEKT